MGKTVTRLFRALLPVQPLRAGLSGVLPGQMSGAKRARCQRQVNSDPWSARRFLLTVATLPKIIGGCVVIVRRVKKGPGRRPQSAKRQRFVELRGRGWSIMAAAREVGVSRTTGNNLLP
jgi:hypothetical protein